MLPCLSKSVSSAVSSLRLMATYPSNCSGPDPRDLNCSLSLSYLIPKPSRNHASSTSKYIQNLTCTYIFHCYNSYTGHHCLSPGVLQWPPKRSSWLLLTSITYSPPSSQRGPFRPKVRSRLSSTQ